MIGSLKGTLIDQEGTLLTIECAGVGYESLVSESALTNTPKIGETIFLYVRQIVREDGVSLYGFFEKRDRLMFDLLRDVQGCGPKVALSLLSSVGPLAIVHAVLNGKPKELTKASGVGPKLADRIALELKSKLGDEWALMRSEASVPGNAKPASESENELIDALQSLGYKRSEAELAASHSEVLQEGHVASLQDQLRVALAYLRKG